MTERAALAHDHGNPTQETPADAEPRPEPARRGPAAVVAYGRVRMHPSARVTNVRSSWPVDTAVIVPRSRPGKRAVARFIDASEQVLRVRMLLATL